MLVPVAQHQSRFVVPGHGVDARGVAIGRSAVAVFPSLDRLLSALTSLTRDVDVDELYRELAVLRLRSCIGQVELVLAFPAVDGHLLDRVSALASLHGGELLTGDGRHMVRYRDRQSPLGYDVERLSDSGSEMILYGRLAEGGYRVEERIPLRRIVLRVGTEPVRRRPEASGPSLVLCAPGLRGEVESYLHRHDAGAEVALVEISKTRLSQRGASRPDGGPRPPSRGFLYRLRTHQSGLLAPLEGMPGATVFLPVGRHAAVEAGFAHPFALHACEAALEPFGLHLFLGGRTGALVIESEALVFMPLARAARMAAGESMRVLEPREPRSDMRGKFRLVADRSPPTEVAAVMIPRDSEQLFLRLVYLLPPGAMESYKAAVLEEGVLVVGGPSIEGVPCGIPLGSFGDGILLPSGTSLRPRASPRRAAELLGGTEGRYVLFTSAGKEPIAVSHASLRPLDTTLISRLAAAHAATRSLPGPTSSPRVVFDEPARLSLWGDGGVGGLGEEG